MSKPRAKQSDFLLPALYSPPPAPQHFRSCAIVGGVTLNCTCGAMQELLNRPRCAHCPEERPAVCLGKYENMQEYEYACAECCGHGNEDGHCEMIGEN